MSQYLDLVRPIGTSTGHPCSTNSDVWEFQAVRRGYDDCMCGSQLSVPIEACLVGH